MNRLNKKKHDHINRCSKDSTKFIYLCDLKNSQPTKNKGNFLYLIKSICGKFTTNITLSVDILNVFLLRCDQSKDVVFDQFYLIMYWKSLPVK